MTNEQEQRLKQIRARWDHSGALENIFSGDIKFLLSLVDSQVVGSFTGPCVHCGHNNYDAERSECRQRWMEGQYSVVCGCPCAKHSSLANASTAMRSACIEKVKALLEYEIVYGERRSAMIDVIRELESVTIQVQKS